MTKKKLPILGAIANSVGKQVGDSMAAKEAEDERQMLKAIRTIFKKKILTAPTMKTIIFT